MQTGSFAEANVYPPENRTKLLAFQGSSSSMASSSSSSSSGSGLDLTKERELLADPRYEAGLESKKEGRFSDAVEFFSELLASFEDQSESFLAPLYYAYGSTLVCIVEEDGQDEEEEGAGSPGETAAGNAREDDSNLGAEEPEKKKAKEERGAAAAESSAPDSAFAVESTNEGEDSGEEEDDEDDDADLAWKLLDAAREMYQAALDRSPAPDLEIRLHRDQSRVLSRLGDLNMLTSNYGDALVEFEQVSFVHAEVSMIITQTICRKRSSRFGSVSPTPPLRAHASSPMRACRWPSPTSSTSSRTARSTLSSTLLTGARPSLRSGPIVRPKWSPIVSARRAFFKALFPAWLQIKYVDGTSTVT